MESAGNQRLFLKKKKLSRILRDYTFPNKNNKTKNIFLVGTHKTFRRSKKKKLLFKNKKKFWLF
jgi:hypothetical protein